MTLPLPAVPPQVTPAVSPGTWGWLFKTGADSSRPNDGKSPPSDAHPDRSVGKASPISLGAKTYIDEYIVYKDKQRKKINQPSGTYTKQTPPDYRGLDLKRSIVDLIKGKAVIESMTLKDFIRRHNTEGTIEFGDPPAPPVERPPTTNEQKKATVELITHDGRALELSAFVNRLQRPIESYDPIELTKLVDQLQDEFQHKGDIVNRRVSGRDVGMMTSFAKIRVNGEVLSIPVTKVVDAAVDVMLKRRDLQGLQELFTSADLLTELKFDFFPGTLVPTHSLAIAALGYRDVAIADDKSTEQLVAQVLENRMPKEIGSIQAVINEQPARSLSPKVLARAVWHYLTSDRPVADIEDWLFQELGTSRANAISSYLEQMMKNALEKDAP
jgi:hypothetical protein